MAKTARKKSAEEFYSLSQKALEDPKLVEIVERAPIKSDGRTNYTHVYNSSFEYVYSQTKDLKKAKELAVANRWAAKFKDEYSLEFGTEAAEANIKTTLTEISKPTPKDVEISLPSNVGIVAFTSSHSLLIRKDIAEDVGIRLAMQVLAGITGLDFSSKADIFDSTVLKAAFRDCLIKILEEKFGMKIRICINCAHCDVIFPKEGLPSIICGHPQNTHRDFFCTKNEYWTPREIPKEKKQEEKTCGNCGINVIDMRCFSCHGQSHWLPRN